MTRRILVLAAIMLLLIGLAGWAIPSPEDTGALQEFIQLLEPCLAIEAIEVHPFEEPFPAQCYCMYYTSPFDCCGLDFGWYWESPESCGALYRVLEGSHPDCADLTDCADGSVLPMNPAMVIPIAEAFESIGFWINNASSNLPVVTDSLGHYFTNPERNWHQDVHAFAYVIDYSRINPNCICDCHGTSSDYQDKGRGYLLFWEDDCQLQDIDWRDLRVALLPCEQGCVCDTTPINLNTGEAAWEVLAPNTVTYVPAQPTTPNYYWTDGGDTTAQWIDHNGSSAGSNWVADPLGTYEYRVSFPLDPECCESCLLNLEFSADDHVTFYLDTPNGAAYDLSSYGCSHQSMTEAYWQMHTCSVDLLALCSMPGTYRLRARVTNDQTVTGLLVSGNVTCMP